MLKYTASLALLLSLAACGPRHVAFVPASRSTTADSEALYKSTLRVVSDNGLAIATKDAEAGLVVTEWEASKLLSTPLRLRWRFTIDAGEISVVSQCQQEQAHAVTGAKSWLDCGNQPADRNQKATTMADAIVSGAK